MTSLGVQITKRIKQSRERTVIQAEKLLLHNCIPLMLYTDWLPVESTRQLLKVLESIRALFVFYCKFSVKFFSGGVCANYCIGPMRSVQ